MEYQKVALSVILPTLDIGNSVAENDDVLESSRVETSVFSDLLEDRVDLVAGTKGSGKSALFRIFTDFMPDHLLERRKIAVAHGVYSHGDSVFMAFEDVFNHLDEDQFVDFWSIYLTKIALTDFVQNPKYNYTLGPCKKEIDEFERTCLEAGIPTTKPHRTFRDLLESALGVLARFVPTFSYDPNDGTFELNPAGNLMNDKPVKAKGRSRYTPKYVSSLRLSLDEILKKSNLRLWLMIDRLDEIFPRRSPVETKALRGLLRTLKEFGTRRIAVKIFLRDDILSQITATGGGFTALTHVTSRQADKLRWSEDQILTLIVNRLFANPKLSSFLKVDPQFLGRDYQYRLESFYKAFPDTMPDGTPTLKWIYESTMDGQGVVTPRDIIDLLVRAKQRQQDELQADYEGTSDWVIGSAAIQYGFDELSNRKRDTLLYAEYPHLWLYIKKFEHRTVSYSRRAVVNLVGGNGLVIDDLVGIGFLKQYRDLHGLCYQIPLIYRKCLQVQDGFKK